MSIVSSLSSRTSGNSLIVNKERQMTFAKYVLRAIIAIGLIAGSMIMFSVFDREAGSQTLERDKAQVFVVAGAPKEITEAAKTADAVFIQTTDARAWAVGRYTAATERMRKALIEEKTTFSEFTSAEREWLDSMMNARTHQEKIQAADDKVVDAYYAWALGPRNRQTTKL